MKGQNVLTSLFEILLRWRFHPVAFVADISKMYHNVKTGALEGNLRRLLWRNFNQDQASDTYIFQKVTFGDKPAGCIAVSALKATADMFSALCKDAADVIKKDTYMDDVVSGEETLERAKELAIDEQEIVEKGNSKFVCLFVC